MQGLRLALALWSYRSPLFVLPSTRFLVPHVKKAHVKTIAAVLCNLGSASHTISGDTPYDTVSATNSERRH